MPFYLAVFSFLAVLPAAKGKEGRLGNNRKDKYLAVTTEQPRELFES